MKREVAVLIPYKLSNRGVSVFLQKREKTTKVLPGCFSFFGGKIEEGETPEVALKREIMEELEFELRDYAFLETYDSIFGGEIVLHIYYTQVENNFENKIVVHEGEYGKFLSESEVKNETTIMEHDKRILNDFYDLVKNKKP